MNVSNLNFDSQNNLTININPSDKSDRAVSNDIEVSQKIMPNQSANIQSKGLLMQSSISDGSTSNPSFVKRLPKFQLRTSNLLRIRNIPEWLLPIIPHKLSEYGNFEICKTRNSKQGVLIAKFETKAAVEKAFKNLISSDICGVRLKASYIYSPNSNFSNEIFLSQPMQFHSSGLEEIDETIDYQNDDDSSAQTSEKENIANISNDNDKEAHENLQNAINKLADEYNQQSYPEDSPKANENPLQIKENETPIKQNYEFLVSSYDNNKKKYEEEKVKSKLFEDEISSINSKLDQNSNSLDKNCTSSGSSSARNLKLNNPLYHSNSFEKNDKPQKHFEKELFLKTQPLYHKNSLETEYLKSLKTSFGNFQYGNEFQMQLPCYENYNDLNCSNLEFDPFRTQEGIWGGSSISNKRHSYDYNSFDSTKINFISKYENSKESNIINLYNVINGRDKRSTIMIKNIPNKYTQKMLIETFNEHVKNKYDFFYLPIDFKNNCNVGYAFINLIDPFLIIPIFAQFYGKKWTNFNSEKICELRYAKIQGKVELVKHFQFSSVMNLRDRKIKPLILNVPPLTKSEKKTLEDSITKEWDLIMRKIGRNGLTQYNNCLK